MNKIKILFVRPWGIGNVILATPALRALKDKFPEADIDFLGTENGIEIIKGCKIINNIFTIKPESYYDIVFQAHPGTGYWENFNCGKNIYFKKDDYGANEMVSNLELVEAAFGSIGDYREYRPFIPIDDQPEYLLLTPPYLKSIAINTGVGNDQFQLSYRKKWMVSSWIALIRQLVALKYSVILLGARSAEIENDMIVQNFPKDHVYDYTGLTTIKEAASIIKQCCFMISIDSGLAHVAAAVKTPVITLFGPTLPKKNAPYGNEGYVVRKEESLCLLHPCYKDGHYAEKCSGNICMSEISVMDVMEKVLILIKNQKI